MANLPKDGGLCRPSTKGNNFQGHLGNVCDSGLLDKNGSIALLKVSYEQACSDRPRLFRNQIERIAGDLCEHQKKNPEYSRIGELAAQVKGFTSTKQLKELPEIDRILIRNALDDRTKSQRWADTIHDFLTKLAMHHDE